MKKAFTLIELLAVLVILAIILLIAYPLISKVILAVKRDSVKITAEMLIKAVEQECFANNLKGVSNTRSIIFTDGAMGAEQIKFSGEVPKNGAINITASCDVELVIHDGQFCARKEYGQKLVKIGEGSFSDCSNDLIAWNNYTPAQVDPLFAARYGGTDSDEFFSVTEYDSNHVVAVGDSMSYDYNLQGLWKGNYDATIVMYNLDGSITWKKNYGGNAQEQFDFVTVLPDSSIIAVGFSYSTNSDLVGLNKGQSDAIIVKFDALGNIVWKKNFGGPSYDNFKGAIATSDGGVIAVGDSQSTTGDMTGLGKGNIDAIMVKYDSLGNVVWKKSYGGSQYDHFYSIATNGSDEYFVVGQSSSNDVDLVGLNKGAHDAIIVKYDSLGNVLWKKNYGGEATDVFRSVAYTQDGELIVAGDSNSTTLDLVGLNKGDNDGIIVKYDATGSVIWKKNYGGMYDEYIYSVLETSAKEYIITGFSDSDDQDVLGLNKGGTDGVVAKFDTTGNIVWKKNYGGTSYDYLVSSTIIDNGSLIIGGYSDSLDQDLKYSNIGTNDSLLLEMKMDSSYGIVSKFASNYYYGGSGMDTFRSIVSYGDKLITFGFTASINFHLAEYETPVAKDVIVTYGKDGSIASQKIVTEQNEDLAKMIMLNSNKFLLIGYCYDMVETLNCNENGDGFLRMLDASFETLWIKNFGGSDYDDFYAATELPDGSIIVVGEGDSTDGELNGINTNYEEGLIVKYDALGNKQWAKVLGGTDTDWLDSVAAFNDGSFVTAGTTYSNDGNVAGLNKGGDDGLIAKYDHLGNIIWVKSTGGSASDRYNKVIALADGSSIAVGSGESNDGDFTGLNYGGGDAIIVKYDTLGNILWKKNFGGSSWESFEDLVGLQDGSLIAVGTSSSTDNDLVGLSKGGQDTIIVKYDATGNLQWKKTFGGTSTDRLTKITKISENSFALVGDSNSSNGDIKEINKGSNDAILIKIDASGNFID